MLSARHSYYTSFSMLLYFVLIFLFTYSCETKSRRVLLRNVDVITLHHDRLAESRKGYRLPQLKCVGGSGFKYPQYYPKVVQCYNRGFDGHDVQWECKAELDKSVSLGSINVNCEGYDYPDDEFIVYDSCALEYELNVRSPIRVKRYNRVFDKVSIHVQNNSGYFIIIGLIVLAIGIWYFCIRPSEFTHESIPSSTGFDSSCPRQPPPPPYEEAVFNDHEDHSTRCRRNPSAPPSPEYGWSSNVMGSSQSRSRWNWNKVENQSGSWLSNGLAAGAGFLGGYFMGSRSHSNPGRSSSGCYSRTEPIFTEEPCIRNGDIYSDSSFSSHSRRSRTPSPETHISSGFGGTSRR
uniref:Store-operated calcium entry-associated regulatory factor n=1 Tax=Schistosoma japonicum TaxID=6182 RepID=Q5D9J3_SCHJA|nr:SJCHGC00596 protein [Schistosoma japonicum]